jgi:ankyrin repeat protein
MNISVLHQKMSEALLSGNILAIEILLEIGIPMNLEQLTKETLEDLIFSAVKERNTTIIKSIIHTGIDLNIKNNIGFTLIHNASLEIETLEILINAKVNVNMQDKFGRTSLHWAESRGDIDVCKILLDAGADVNIQEMENGQTALHSAIWKKDIKIAQMLLNAGAVVNLKDKKKRTVLKEVEKTNNPEMIKIIKMHDLKSAFVS